MKQRDCLQLVGQGSLQRPGPIGRIVRLALGIACFYALSGLLMYREGIISTPVSVFPNIIVLMIPAFLVFKDVVNIGFGVNWGRWPLYASVATATVLAGIGWGVFGSPDHPVLGLPLWLWLVYFYGHLGVSFVLSAIISTPGCEMRSIPGLYGKITGRPIQEHHCPAFIARIDNWERGKPRA